MPSPSNLFQFTDSRTVMARLRCARALFFSQATLTFTATASLHTRWIDGCGSTAVIGFSNRARSTEFQTVSPRKLAFGNTYRFQNRMARISNNSRGDKVNPFGKSRFDPLGNVFDADCHPNRFTTAPRRATPYPHFWGRFWKPAIGFVHDDRSRPRATRYLRTGVLRGRYFPVEYATISFSANPVTVVCIAIV